MHDVVVVSVARQMSPDGVPEGEWWTERSPFILVDATRVDEADHAYVRKRWRLVRVPVAHRQVGDVVSGLAEPESEVAHPALGAADRLGENVVVDEADAHYYACVGACSSRASGSLNDKFG